MPIYNPGERTKCPYCQTMVKFEIPMDNEWNGHTAIIRSPKYRLKTIHSQCPSCLKFIVSISEIESDDKGYINESLIEKIIWPITSSRDPAPPDVPSHISQDYMEAALVLPISPKASAALSRRCLQSVLREEGKTKAKDLAEQIQEAVPTLPSRIAENLDAIRAIGNFAAHPIKSQVTGNIVEVEVGEAEWNLDVLDALFDHYYVRPVLEQKKRDALNVKLIDAGKPPIK
ncbi:MAG: DUF4145 domain-containing protein [Anaerolineales bacterium]|nr:DUF4145 domain-containing protein [Anaerolineales bacterium]